jgi:hypothetical protein
MSTQPLLPKEPQSIFHSFNDLYFHHSDLIKELKSRSGGKIYLSYNHKSGWKTVHLNFFQVGARRLGAYPSTRLKNIVAQLRNEADLPYEIVILAIKWISKSKFFTTSFRSHELKETFRTIAIVQLFAKQTPPDLENISETANLSNGKYAILHSLFPKHRPFIKRTYQNLGKAHQTYLCYHNTLGPLIKTLTPTQNLARKCGFYRSTHLKAVVRAIERHPQQFSTYAIGRIASCWMEKTSTRNALELLYKALLFTTPFKCEGDLCEPRTVRLAIEGTLQLLHALEIGPQSSPGPKMCIYRDRELKMYLPSFFYTD